MLSVVTNILLENDAISGARFVIENIEGRNIKPEPVFWGIRISARKKHC